MTTFTVSVKIRHVLDANHAWATPETIHAQISITTYTFYFNPSIPMTLEDVATILENGSIRVGPTRIRVGRIIVRGYDIARQDLAKYNAADLMKDGEILTIVPQPACCTVL